MKHTHKHLLPSSNEKTRDQKKDMRQMRKTARIAPNRNSCLLFIMSFIVDETESKKVFSVNRLATAQNQCKGIFERLHQKRKDRSSGMSGMRRKGSGASCRLLKTVRSYLAMPKTSFNPA